MYFLTEQLVYHTRIVIVDNCYLVLGSWWKGLPSLKVQSLVYNIYDILDKAVFKWVDVKAHILIFLCNMFPDNIMKC